MTTAVAQPPTTTYTPSAGQRPGQAASDAASSHQVAARFLVQACERALFELRCSLGEATRPADVRAGLEAAALLEQVLAGWRDTLQQLQAAGAAGGHS